MRNLYSRLGLDSSAGINEISSAIQEGRDEKLVRDATVVLLDEQIRSAYDAAHHALTDIGTIRGALDMDASDYWNGALVDDYSNPGAVKQSLYARLARKLGTPEDEKPASATFPAVFGSLFKSTCHLALYGLAVVMLSLTLDQFAGGESDSQRYIGATIPLPYNADIRLHTEKDAIAPFQITAADLNHHLVQLFDIRSDELVLDVFVRQGYTAHVRVPFGAYSVRYVSGTHWYGYQDYFGFDTQIQDIEEPMIFGAQGYRIVGHTIELPYDAKNIASLSAIDATGDIALESSDQVSR